MPKSFSLYKILILCIFILQAGSVYGQYVHGTIKDETGAIMPYASVYVKESTYGVSSDARAYYFLTLKPGKYTLLVSFIGYQTEEFDVNIQADRPVRHDIVLRMEAISLHEVDIVANTKDMAKEIMQNVRNKRKFYLSQVEGYTCRTYLKTSLEKELVKPTKKDTLSEIQRIDSNTVAITVAPEIKDIKGYFKKEKLNLIESFSETYYKEPGKYKEKITAYHDYAERKLEDNSVEASIGIEVGEEDIAPEQRSAPNPYILYEDVASAELNFYKNLIHYNSIVQKPLLSPIAATSAMSYIYNLEGSFYQDDKKIYKISVRPIIRAEALFNGTIFIEDSTWALVSLDLNINKAALYFCREFNIIQNYSSIHKDVYLPVRRELTYTIKDGKYHILGNTRVEHSGYQINPEFEEKIFNNEVKTFAVDAYDKDSLFWTDSRPILLKESELDFIKETDSISEYFVSEEYYSKIDSSFNKINFWSLINGVGHRNRYRGTEWYIEGILNQINPFGIGGYRHKLPLSFQKEFHNGMMLESKIFADYGFKNQDVKAKGGIGLTYFPMRFVRTYITLGDYYDMINDYASLESTFSRSNYVRSRLIGVSQRMEIVNGLFGELAFEYSNQTPIVNMELTSWFDTIFSKELNEPVDFLPYVRSELRLKLKYRIRQQYMIKNKKKIIIGSKYPEIWLKYRKGIEGLFNSEVNFDFIEIGAEDELKLARFGSSRWQIQAGTFLNKKNLRILEYKYFRGSDRFFFSDPLQSFQLMASTLNTPSEYFRANYLHHFEGALLNKVPVLNRLKLAVAAGAGTLLIPDSDFAHFEMFAGLERVFRIRKQLFRIGAYAVTADNSLSNPDITFKFGISFFNTFTNKWDY